MCSETSIGRFIVGEGGCVCWCCCCAVEEKDEVDTTIVVEVRGGDGRERPLLLDVDFSLGDDDNAKGRE